MKKSLLSLTFILSSWSLFANSHVGDQIVLEGLAMGLFPLKLTQTVSSFDASKGMYFVDSITEVGGTTQTETEEVEEVWDHSIALQILAQCAALGGSSEQLNIMGGTYDTCKVESVDNIVGPVFRALNLKPRSNGYVWIGDFPVLGAARVESDSATLEITSFNWAN